jgi:hypothetical protein
MKTNKESYCVKSEHVIIWYRNGTDDIYHCVDGPAVEYISGSSITLGHKEWWVDGQLHREDGPAIIYADGIEEWWYRDHRIMVSNLKEFQSYVRNKAFW